MGSTTSLCQSNTAMTKNTKILLLFSTLALASASKSSFYDVLAKSKDSTIYERSRRDVVDPHSKDLHCVDVSTYEEVRTKCTATFPKIRESKSEEVCEIVTTLKCEIEGYTECKMEMVPVQYNGFKMEDKEFVPQTCEVKPKMEMHKKLKPECKNVTKQNCVTKWVVKPSGQKVWDGNEDCEEVEWEECKLVEYLVPFEVPKITCTPGEEIPWMDCVDDTKTQMTSKMTCEPKSTVSCSPETTELCIPVRWEEFRQEPKPECSIGKVFKPRQEVSHKKKCLLPDSGTRLPNAPLQNLRPKENLVQNVFPNPNNPNGKRSARDFGPGGRPSPVFVPDQ